MPTSANASSYSAIKDKITARMGSRFSVYSPVQSWTVGRFSARQRTSGASAGRFSIVSPVFITLMPSRFSAIRKSVHKNAVRFSARFPVSNFKADRYSARYPTGVIHLDRFGLHGVSQVKALARSNSYFPPGWILYARNINTGEVVNLGFIYADSEIKEINDVPLSDGVWEIEARPQEWFWNGCRTRKVVTLVAGEVDIEGEPLQGLPAIQNLRREIILPAGQQAPSYSLIQWKVSTEYDPCDFQFGLWFGSSSPVDTSGTPDAVVPCFTGQGDYQYSHIQSASEFVAVAAFTNSDQGPIAELELPWDSVPPTSPPNQSGT